MFKKIMFFVGLSLLAQQALAAEPAKTPAKPDVKVTKDEMIGKWRYQCEEATDAAGKKISGCGASQKFTYEDKQTKKQAPIFVVDLMHDKKDNVSFFRLRTPLGTALSQGVALKVANKEIKKASFTTCFASVLGCYATLPITPYVDSALKNNAKVQFFYRSYLGASVPVDIETKGYADILNKLKM